MSFIQFESGTEKEKIRQELRDAREELLKRAQKNAEIRAERKTAKKLRGDDNWMHPSVLNKIEDDSEISSVKKSKKSSKKSKKEKKSKKSKKEKKQKKNKRKYSSTSSSEEEIIKKKKQKRRDSTEEESSDDSDDSNSDDEWIEKSTRSTQEEVRSEQAETSLARDDWMTGGFLLKTYSKHPVEKKERQTIDSYDPKKCSRELNPYWKDGGNGLPSFQRPKDDDNDDEDTRKRNLKSSYRSEGYTPRGNWRKKPEVSENKKTDGPRTSSISTSKDISQNERCLNVKHSKEPSRSTNRRPKHQSSSSSSDNEVEENVSVSKPPHPQPDQLDFLTDQQMNELGAKIIKAEIMGDAQLAKELNEKLGKARELRNNIKSGSVKLDNVKPPITNDEEEHILLTTTDSKGNIRPLAGPSTSVKPSDPYGKSKKGKRTKTETHVGGERVRYFPDDDRYDIKQMFEREKYTTAQDVDAQFAEIAGKHKNPKDDLEDVFADKVRRGLSDYDKDEKEKSRAIREHEQFSKMLDSCDRCFESSKMEKQLIVSMGSTVYLSLPWHEGLQVGHCLISPIQHVSCSTQLDEDTWSEINDFRKALTRLFESKSQDVIFFETAKYLHRRPHMVIHCVASKNFEMAPFYFKKAIQESEQMWSTNKQLIPLKDTNLRRAVPKGLPYFWVNFGMDSGFAHVIEDQERFPSNFAQEVIGGLLNLDTKSWRKPRREYNPIPKVKQFAEMWKKFDCSKK